MEFRKIQFAIHAAEMGNGTPVVSSLGEVVEFARLSKGVPHSRPYHWNSPDVLRGPSCIFCTTSATADVIGRSEQGGFVPTKLLGLKCSAQAFVSDIRPSIAPSRPSQTAMLAFWKALNSHSVG